MAKSRRRDNCQGSGSDDARWPDTLASCALSGGDHVANAMPSEWLAPARDDRSGRRVHQPPPDDSGKASAKEHQQFRTVRRIEALLRALPQREQARR